ASCAHLAYQTITSAGRKGLLERGSVIPEQIAPRIISSDMNEGIMIFGGLEELKQKIAQIKIQKPRYIWVITACASGIIGDDLSSLDELGDSETRIIPILADGNINGDFLQGILLAYLEIGRALIDPQVQPEADTVNLIGEKTEGDTTEANFQAFKELIERLGLKVNCRFICRTTGTEIRRLLAGRLNILAWDDYMGRTIQDFLTGEYGASFMEQPLPVGFTETKEWLEALAAYFGKENLVAEILSDYSQQYKQRLAELKPYLQGKKLAIVSCNYQLDWIIQTALDLDMEVLKICSLYSSQDNCFKTRFEEQIGELGVNCPLEERFQHFPAEADLILQDQIWEGSPGNAFTDTIPFGPPIGFFSGLKLAERWKEIFQMNLKEGWQNDEELYRKYLG
ncbi:MAG: nitrogenase component 1, partial [Clostridia bacterium]|nr:nitrogenase component 1 [Clostridia bacterium]